MNPKSGLKGNYSQNATTNCENSIKCSLKTNNSSPNEFKISDNSDVILTNSSTELTNYNRQPQRNFDNELQGGDTNEQILNYLNKMPGEDYQIITSVSEIGNQKINCQDKSNESNKFTKLRINEQSKSSTDNEFSFQINSANKPSYGTPNKRNKNIAKNSSLNEFSYDVKPIESVINPRLESSQDCIKKESSYLQNPIESRNVTTTNNLTKGSEKVSEVVFARLALVKLWSILFLTTLFCISLMIASYLTHSLTLRIEAYHALYNVLALSGCLITMKICQGPQSLKNTFGWARFELLSCLCTLLFIASLCFSVTLESIQIVAHAGHQEPMHHPLPVIALCGIGLCFNGFVFCLIGGFTHHQGCFLERRGSDVWVQRNVPQEAVQAGMRTISSFPFHKIAESPLPRSYQGMRGILRDISGLISTMLCAVIIYLNKKESLTLYVDPVFALISASVLLVLSFPYGKECCQILLQTIPGNIDVQTFSAKLLQEIPEVINIHHLHIWSLTPGKVIATAHVVYSNPDVYRRSSYNLEQFFLQKDITHVTLQPEFLHISHEKHYESKNIGCLLSCTNNLCREKECCQWSSKPDSTEADNDSKKDVSTMQFMQRTKTSEIGSSGCVDCHGTSAYRNVDMKILPKI